MNSISADNLKLHRGEIGLKNYENKGRGLVALSRFQQNEVIERATVLVFPPQQFETICDSRNKLGPLKSHMLIWDKNESTGEVTAAISYGAMSFCNHNGSPNARFKPDKKNEVVELVALKPIQEGEEICIQYKEPEKILDIVGWDSDY